MNLSGLSDRERQQWYKANQQTLSQYDPAIRRKVAE